MASAPDLRFAFNRGEIGKNVLGRVDRDNQRLAAETCLNWMPTQQGPMMLRPGTAFIENTEGQNEGKMIPFVFSRTDTAMIVLTDRVMRVLVDDEYVTRASVATTLTNGNFNSQAGWALVETPGASATIANGVLTLAATARGSKAKARQAVTVPVGSRTTEHALRIVVTTGPVLFKVGTDNGLDDLVKRTELGTGTHSLAFTPGGARFVIEFENQERAERIVTSCDLEDAGTLELPTTWRTSQFDFLQFVQSGDVIFVANGSKPKKIERRSETSWSVVDYVPKLGPLRSLKPREKDIKIWSTAFEGNGRLRADEPLFTSDHVGTIFRVFPAGQVKAARIAAANTFGDPIRVTGVDQDRWFNVVISGNFNGRLTLQRSLDGPDSGFTDIARDSNTIEGQSAYNNTGTYEVKDHNAYNNSVVWYRVGFKEDDYNSGTAVVSFSGTPTGNDTETASDASETGGTAGYARVTRRLSATVAEIEILKPFSSLNKTDNWMIGEWNGDDGYPTAVTLFDGRLWWGGKDRIWGSVSDDYENFDHDFEGDAGPISRSLGSGPVDTISWLLALARLMAGRGMAVSSIRSSNFDEPLTPTNFTIKDASTRGAARVQPAQVDSRGVYIHANNRQIFELAYRVETQDYTAVDLTMFHPDIGLEGFSRLAVARSPDTRFFVVRDDGQIAVVLREQDGDSQLASWWRMTTGPASHLFEDVAVLPGDLEDKVYVIVKRVIAGVTKRYIEVFSRRDECIGEPLTKCLDSHVVYNSSATRTITGLSHLNGQTVRVWGAADGATTGRDLGEYVVSGGSVGLLPIQVTKAVVGLPYTATFKSVKLAYGAGLSIGSQKRIDQISFVLFDTHCQGVTFGQDLNSMEPMPAIEFGDDVDTDTIWSHYDRPMTSLPGRWDVDTRLYLRAASPRPATVGAVLVAVEASGRTN